VGRETTAAIQALERLLLLLAAAAVVKAKLVLRYL
jgi:hypothetical protein